MSTCEYCGKNLPSGKKRRFCNSYCGQTAYNKRNKEALNKQAAARRRKDREVYGTSAKWRYTKAQELRAWYDEAKSHPCHDCHNSFPTCCMDFDHVIGEKEYNVAAMVSHNYSLEKVKAEAAKCELVCSNCHRIRTRDRLTGVKQNPRKKPNVS